MLLQNTVRTKGYCYPVNAKSRRSYLYLHAYTHVRNWAKRKRNERQALHSATRERESRGLETVRSWSEGLVTSSNLGHSLGSSILVSYSSQRGVLSCCLCCNKRENGSWDNWGEIMEILLSLLLHRVTLDYRAPPTGAKKEIEQRESC